MSKLTVAVVDDDEPLRRAMLGLIRSFGFDAVGYASAEAFLAGGIAPIGCIVADVQMPGLSGIDLTDVLAATGDTTPVIVMTARSDEALEAQALACGARFFLRKPINGDTLLDLIQRATAP